MSQWSCKRSAVFLTCAVILSGCAATSGNKLGNLSIGHVNLPALAIPAPAPVILPPPCPAELLADIPDRPHVPVGAGFPAAETPQASDAEQLYLTWLAAFGQHDAAGWRRALIAKALCEHKP